MDCSGPGGWRALHLGVGPLVCPGQGCLCGGAPCGRGPGALSVWSVPKGHCLRSRCTAMSVSNRCSGSELVCVCVPVCLCVSLGIYGGGRVSMFYHCCFLASVRHFVLLLKYERCHIK